MATQWEGCIHACHAEGNLSKVNGMTPHPLLVQAQAAATPPDEMELDWSASATGQCMIMQWSLCLSKEQVH